MEFRTRMLGAAAGTAVLGLAALTIAGATASHPGHPRATTLAAVSHARPSAAPGRKQIEARPGSWRPGSKSRADRHARWAGPRAPRRIRRRGKGG